MTVDVVRETQPLPPVIEYVIRLSPTEAGWLVYAIKHSNSTGGNELGKLLKQLGVKEGA